MKKIYYFIFILLIAIFLVAAQEIATEEENYINYFLKEQGIDTIKTVEKVNETTLPEEIDISNVNENQIGVYGVTYEENGIEKKLFVFSYSEEEFKKPDIKTISEKNYLTFSKPDSVNSGYINSGYIMLNSGSIIGLSTTANVDNGKIIVEVHKNGQPMLISNEFFNNYDFDLESKNLDTFEIGDVISIYIKTEGGASVENLNSLILIESE